MGGLSAQPNQYNLWSRNHDDPDEPSPYPFDGSGCL